MRRLIARFLSPRSYCSGCGQPFFSDRRRPCHCGETARSFRRVAHDSFATKDTAR